MSGSLRVLRNSDFLRLWLVQIASQGGLRMFQIVLAWWLVGAGGKAIGLFMVAAALPSILLARPIGRAVDRRPASILLPAGGIFAGAGALATALLFAADRLPFPLLLLASFLLALAQGLLDPSFNKSLQEVVDAEETGPAVSLQTATQPLASFGGAIFGAALIETLGIPSVLSLSAAGYLAAAGLAVGIRFRPGRVPAWEMGNSTDSEQPAGPADPYGRKFLLTPSRLRNVLLGFGAVNFFLTPTLIVLPLYTSKTLGASATVLGFLEGSLWAGLLLGALLAEVILRGKEEVRAGGTCLLLTGGALLIPGIAVSAALLLGALFVVGCTIGMINVKFVSLFQRIVAPESKGRFFAVLSAMVSAAFPVSYFLFGLLGDAVSPPILCVIQGIGIASVALYFVALGHAHGDAAAPTVPRGGIAEAPPDAGPQATDTRPDPWDAIETPPPSRLRDALPETHSMPSQAVTTPQPFAGENPALPSKGQDAG